MKSSVPRRGVQDIRTMSERISDADNPQRKYLALAMLELEKARRNKEKQSASQRVANIDQRLADITAEQTELACRRRSGVGHVHAGRAAGPGRRLRTRSPEAVSSSPTESPQWRLTTRKEDRRKWKRRSTQTRLVGHSVAEAQAVAREFLAGALPDVQRVDIIEGCPVTLGRCDLGGGSRRVAAQCDAQEPRHRDRAARVGS